jgi:hypothetical protein
MEGHGVIMTGFAANSVRLGQPRFRRERHTMLASGSSNEPQMAGQLADLPPGESHGPVPDSSPAPAVHKDSATRNWHLQQEWSTIGN